VAAALAEREEDTPDEKLVKDALKSLLEEDSDEVYDFLSKSSSRTFQDIENEGNPQNSDGLNRFKTTRRPSTKASRRTTIRPASLVDEEKNSDSSTKIQTIVSSSTRKPPKRLPTKRPASKTSVSNSSALQRTTVSSSSPVDEASRETEDLGAGNDGDCQTQGGNRRKRMAKGSWCKKNKKPPPKPLAFKKYSKAAYDQKAWIEKNAHSYEVFMNKEKRITDKLQANQFFVEGYADFDIAFQDGRGKGGGKGGPWQPLDKETQGSHRVILMVEDKGKAGLEPLKWYYTFDHYKTIHPGGDF